MFVMRYSFLFCLVCLSVGLKSISKLMNLANYWFIVQNNVKKFKELVTLSGLTTMECQISNLRVISRQNLSISSINMSIQKFKLYIHIMNFASNSEIQVPTKYRVLRKYSTKTGKRRQGTLLV